MFESLIPIPGIAPVLTTFKGIRRIKQQREDEQNIADDYGSDLPDDWESDPVVEIDPEDEAQVAEYNQAFKDLYPNWIGPAPQTPLEELGKGFDYQKTVSRNRRGKRGAIEELTDFEIGDVPFLSWVELPSVFSATKTANKLQAGETPSDEELLNLNLMLERQRRKSESTVLGKAIGTIQGSMAFGAEIAATTLATGGLATGTAVGARTAAGTAGAAAKKASIKAAEKGAQRFVLRALGKKAAKTAAGKAARAAAGKAASAGIKAEMLHKGLSEAAEAAVKKTITSRFGPAVGKYLGKAAGVAANLETRALANQALHPERTVRAIADRRLEQALTNGDESVAASVALGFMDMNIEYASEFAGEYIGAAARRILPERLLKRMATSAILENVIGPRGWTDAKGAQKILRTMGVNGILEEMGEERAGDFVRGLLGVEGDAGLKSAIEGLWPGLEQLAVETIAFSAMPMAARGINRAIGAESYEEFAENLEFFQKADDTSARTESELFDMAVNLNKKLEEESKPWYVDSGWGFLRHVFGSEKRGSVQSLLGRKGIKDLRRVRDLAVAEETKRAKAEGRPTDPRVGIQAIAHTLGQMQQVWSEGIETDEQRELFNAGVKAGDIIKKQERGMFRFFAMPTAMSKSEINKLVRDTGIAYVVEVDDIEREEIGTLTPDMFATDWAKLSPKEKSVFASRWNSKDMGYLGAKYQKFQAIFAASGSADTTVHEVLPMLVRGRKDQFPDGYEIQDKAPVFDQDSDGNDRYVMYFGAETSEDGRDIYISTNASDWSIAEDTIESRLKQFNRLSLFESATSWIDSVRKELRAKPTNKRSESEKHILKALDTPKGRMEFFVKSYMSSRMGYDVIADEHTKSLVREVPVELEADMQAAIGQDLLTALSHVNTATGDTRGAGARRGRSGAAERQSQSTSLSAMIQELGYAEDVENFTEEMDRFGQKLNTLADELAELVDSREEIGEDVENALNEFGENAIAEFDGGVEEVRDKLNDTLGQFGDNAMDEFDGGAGEVRGELEDTLGQFGEDAME